MPPRPALLSAPVVQPTPAVPAAPLLVGVSGPEPGVFRWEPGHEPKRLLAVPAGQSVYALALGPDGSQVALGTKPAGTGAGTALLEVWRVGAGAAASSQPRREARHYCVGAIYAVDWLDADTVVAAGWSGALFAGRLASDRIQPLPLPGTARHGGAVVAVRAVGTERVVTVGNDGLARVWSAPDFHLVREVRVALGTEVAGLPAVVALPAQRTVLIQLTDGRLRVLRADHGFALDEPLPGDPAYAAIALTGDRLVAAEPGGGRLCLLDPGTLAPGFQFDVGVPVRLLAPLAPTLVAAIHVDARVRVWSLEGKGRCEAVLDLPPARRITGERGEVLARAVEQARAREDEERRRALEHSITQARDLGEIRARVHQVLADGLGFEGLVLLADWCRRQEQPLWEVQVRRALCEALPVTPQPPLAIHWRIYGELLLALGEGAAASAALARALEHDPGMAGLADLVVRAEALGGADPREAGALWEPGTSAGQPGSALRACAQRALRLSAVGRALPTGYLLHDRLEILGRSTLPPPPLADLARESQGLLVLETLPVAVEGGVVDHALLTCTLQGSATAGAEGVSLAYRVTAAHGQWILQLGMILRPAPAAASPDDALAAHLAWLESIGEQLAVAHGHLPKVRAEIDEQVLAAASRLLHQQSGRRGGRTTDHPASGPGSGGVPDQF